MPYAISGGARVYVLTEAGGASSMLVKDLVRLDPGTTKLWNGSAWTAPTQWINMSPIANRKRLSHIRALAKFRGHQTDVAGDIEVQIRTGEKIGCTRWSDVPTSKGIKVASDLRLGDCLMSNINPPSPRQVVPSLVPDEIGWFVGLYLAKGSRENGYIIISGHANETEARLKIIAPLIRSYHGTYSVTDVPPNSSYIRIRNTILDGILDAYTGGEYSRNKFITTKAWQRSNDFLRNVLDGYLHGDGYYEAKAHRWRIDFCNNKLLASALRLVSSRLGISIRLKPYRRLHKDKYRSAFRGNLIFDSSSRRTRDTEIVSISQSGARNFWQFQSVPRFSLASGIICGDA